MTVSILLSVYHIMEQKYRSMPSDHKLIHQTVKKHLKHAVCVRVLQNNYGIYDKNHGLYVTKSYNSEVDMNWAL